MKAIPIVLLALAGCGGSSLVETVPGNTTTTTIPATTTTVPTTTTPTQTSTTTTTTVPEGIFISAVGTTCQKDVPVIVIKFGDRSDLNGHSGTLTFIDLNGKTIETRSVIYQANGIVTELYPGASVDAQGNATDWPGWVQQANGLWIEDPTDALWRQGLTLVVSVNPTAETQVSYPPASSACASPENPPIPPSRWSGRSH